MKVKKVYSYERQCVSVEPGDGSDPIELELAHEPNDRDDVLVEPLPGGGHLVGYLVRDTDCENPLESCDGMGAIHIGLREYRNETRRAFREALGVDEYGDRVARSDRHTVLLDVYQHGGEVWRVHGSGRFFPDERWDVSNCAGVWVPSDDCREHIQWKTAEALFGIKIGSTCETVEYKGGRRYTTTYDLTLPNGHVFKRFFSLPALVRAAARALGRPRSYRAELDELEMKEAETCAEQAVEQYNSWINGDCYGVVVETLDADGEQVDEDSCWGYIGRDYAAKELRMMFNDTVASHKSTP